MALWVLIPLVPVEEGWAGMAGKAGDPAGVTAAGVDEPADSTVTSEASRG